MSLDLLCLLLGFLLVVISINVKEKSSDDYL